MELAPLARLTTFAGNHVSTQGADTYNAPRGLTSGHVYETRTSLPCLNIPLSATVRPVCYVLRFKLNLVA